MTDKERIADAERNMRRYLEDELIVKSPLRKDIFQTFKRNSKESFDVSEKLLNDNSSSLWVVVTAYYSMYYIANAAIYKFGYKIGSKISHQITADALVVFVRNKLKTVVLNDFEDAQAEALDITKTADEIIDSFAKELSKRSEFQYETTELIKRESAKTSLERARRFIFEMEKLC